MQTDDKADIRKTFAIISILFWLGVALIAVISAPVYQLMKLAIQMRAEYSLLEQMTKFMFLQKFVGFIALTVRCIHRFD